VSAIFVTGAGTEVGKTYLTCGLLRRLRARGVACEALKPVVSGFDEAGAAASDSALLLAALGRELDAAALDRISPWRFRAPLSPDIAAAREGRTIDVAQLVATCRAATRAVPAGATLLIEGVGGIHVPLDATQTVADWIDALALPVVLVGGTYLGALSHTLAALEVLRGRGSDVVAVVANASPEGAVTLEETVRVLARFTHGVPVVGLARDAGPEDPAFAALMACIT